MSNQTRMSLSPSTIQTVTVGPGIPPGHVLRLRSALAGCTADRELHPAPKVYYSIVGIIPNYSALTMQSTGQTSTHFGVSWWPTHSTQVAWSITYRTPSPSLMDSVGHSGMHAPQAMHSSLIFMLMMDSPEEILVKCIPHRVSVNWRMSLDSWSLS